MLDRYRKSKPLLPKMANQSRLVSGRRHGIGDKNLEKLYINVNLENLNAAIKQFRLYRDTVPLQKMESGK